MTKKVKLGQTHPNYVHKMLFFILFIFLLNLFVLFMKHTYMMLVRGTLILLIKRRYIYFSCTFLYINFFPALLLQGKRVLCNIIYYLWRKSKTKKECVSYHYQLMKILLLLVGWAIYLCCITMESWITLFNY
jgi:hypothetical protein